MAERYQRNRRTRQMPNEETYGFEQAEQYDDSTNDQAFVDTEQRGRGYGGQMGERGGGHYRNSEFGDREMRRGRSNMDDGYDRGTGSFAGDDRGGRDFQRNRQAGGTYLDDDHMSYGDRSRGSDGYGRTDYRSSGYRGERGDHDRGFFEKAGDEIASWFGDEDASRRRKIDHRGAGPSNYTRSDDRILEDACDNLTDDWAVDARNVQVTVKDGEVTLDGTVDSRSAKRRAEDCVDCISGVKHVQNNLRVQDRVGESADYSERELENGRI